jgi:predicted dehydrogenase
MTFSKRKNLSAARISRRNFVAASAGALAGAPLACATGGGSGGVLAQSADLAPHTAGNETIRVGLVGCGGRGTGAADEALRAEPNAVLVAMGDLFADRLASSLDHLQKSQDIGARVRVPDDARFTGFDAYKKVIAACDVVLLCSTPHFRPAHLKEAVAQSKHIFCEKPIAVDAPGVRSVLASVAEARQKKLSLVSGFCWRYSLPDQTSFGKVLSGDLGEITAIHTRYLTGTLSLRERKPEWSDMETQLRNWYYYTWASGDHIVEQAVHSINKIAWAMNDETPVAATAVGGRQVRTGPEFGNAYDHFAVVYEYKNGARGFHDCRQTDSCFNDNTDFIIGTKGTLFVNSWGPTHVIKGEKSWHWEGDAGTEKYLREHEVLFTSIRKGEAYNDGVQMANSTMMAILGRMCAYTGQRITWKEAITSKEDLTPERYEWGAVAVPPVAMPGKTRFA